MANVSLLLASTLFQGALNGITSSISLMYPAAFSAIGEVSRVIRQSKVSLSARNDGISINRSPILSVRMHRMLLHDANVLKSSMFTRCCFFWPGLLNPGNRIGYSNRQFVYFVNNLRGRMVGGEWNEVDHPSQLLYGRGFRQLFFGVIPALYEYIGADDFD